MKIFIAIIVICAFAASLLFYPALPEQMTVHWNAEGEPDGYMSTIGGVMIIPIIMLFIGVLALVLPRMDPLRQNFRKYAKAYYATILLILLFLLYLHGVMIAWNLGLELDMMRMIAPALGVLFIVIGALLQKSRRNWFFGIRTPWTISNDKVWKKTHRLGSYLFMISGVLALFGAIIPRMAIWFILVPILSTVVISFVYSYYLYRKVSG